MLSRPDKQPKHGPIEIVLLTKPAEIKSIQNQHRSGASWQPRLHGYTDGAAAFALAFGFAFEGKAFLMPLYLSS